MDISKTGYDILTTAEALQEYGMMHNDTEDCKSMIRNIMEDYNVSACK